MRQTAFYPAFTEPEPAADVFIYVGTPSDNIGNNGDFYLEEETNLLYGPKANGAWPEEGVPVSGPIMRHRKRIRQKAWSRPVPKPTLRVKIRLLLAGIWTSCRQRLRRS